MQQLYSFFYNTLRVMQNSFGYLTTSYTEIENDEKYIKSLISEPNFDMSEVRKNTESVLLHKNQDYTNITSYIAGNCWLNSKLTTGIELNNYDKKIYESINNTVKNVIPLSYAINLIHGFELFTNYNEKSWRVGKTISIPGFLSKTPSFEVASRFASMYDKYLQKYMIVIYPEGSQHISLDIRPNDEEFEYLTFSNEKLKLVRIAKLYKFPHMSIFYVFKSKK